MFGTLPQLSLNSTVYVAKTPAVAIESPDPAILVKVPQAISGETVSKNGDPRKCKYLPLTYEATQKENKPDRVTENVIT